MDDIIKLKCPLDGIVLTIKNEPGIEKRVLTCPVCKRKYPFSQFRMDAQTPGASHPSGTPAGGTCPDNDDTDLVTINRVIGRLVIPGAVFSFQLLPGHNVIGRKSASSRAEFQIETNGKKGMSREHIVINVKKEPDKGFVHYLSLFKKQTNTTLLNNQPVAFGDSIVLEHGDIIQLPDTTLRFEIPDEDETVF
ncbi:MAG: FHA domain-containing protein [Bacteroidales bacterium]|nr:FHA domain-containing protein [Bacteroidales bacterium]